MAKSFLQMMAKLGLIILSLKSVAIRCGESVRIYDSSRAERSSLMGKMRFKSDDSSSQQHFWEICVGTSDSHFGFVLRCRHCLIAKIPYS